MEVLETITTGGFPFNLAVNWLTNKVLLGQCSK